MHQYAINFKLRHSTPFCTVVDIIVVIHYPVITCSLRGLLFSQLQLHSLFIYKNVVIPAQAEYSYFSADFRLKIFLYCSQIIAYSISVLVFGIQICIVLHCARALSLFVAESLGRFGFKKHFAEKQRDGNESNRFQFVSAMSKTIKCNRCSKLLG